MKDFDEFCEKNNIQPGELGVAFAAWMSQAIGWNGDYKEVTNPDIGASATSDALPEYECAHQWVHKAGAGYRATPVAICVKCNSEKRYCAKCGEKP